jgi:hypothetical protein
MTQTHIPLKVGGSHAQVLRAVAPLYLLTPRTQTLDPKLTIVRYCSILSARLRVAVLYSVLFSLFAFTARPEQTAVCRQTHTQQQVRVSSCCYLLSECH